jgi:hypothetical protein
MTLEHLAQVIEPAVLRKIAGGPSTHFGQTDTP